MGLFDELGDDTLKPGKGAELALRRELETRREKWERHGYFYRGAGDLLLQHGRFFTGRVLPDEYAHLRGPRALCFGNAMEAVQADPSLTYYEGVYSTGGGHFTTHGWCVAPDGGVVELTYPTDPEEHEEIVAQTGGAILPAEHWGYWGVPFAIELVDWHFHQPNHGLPMIDRSHRDGDHAPHLDVSELHDFPILKVPYDPARTSL
jgi:hypothetical protein